MAQGRMQFFSNSMKRITEFSFIIPNDVNAFEKLTNPHFTRPAKTLILLHGYSGIDTDWIWGGGNANLLSRKYNLNIIMPTAGNNFYLDRKSCNSKYGSFIYEELFDYVHKVFGLSTAREDNFIGGLSMGAYGSMRIGLMHPELFSGVCALSAPYLFDKFDKMKPGDTRGDMDYEYFCEVFGDLTKVKGSDADIFAVLENASKNKDALPSIYLACGTEDDLSRDNHALRDALTAAGVEHKFEEGKGFHDWTFWNDYIQRGLDYLLEN
ncbi:S-formylglutathione hydrolase FrmB [Lachnospiraceae bacterium KH1T2]|nr:S-formylglutathione hydrolase FrmB [Lachnospiraceae bacterium KH1T2]